MFFSRLKGLRPEALACNDAMRLFLPAALLRGVLPIAYAASSVDIEQSYTAASIVAAGINHDLYTTTIALSPQTLAPSTDIVGS